MLVQENYQTRHSNAFGHPTQRNSVTIYISETLTPTTVLSPTRLIPRSNITRGHSMFSNGVKYVTFPLTKLYDRQQYMCSCGVYSKRKI